MHTDIHDTLRAHFGFDTFKPGQKRVIEHLLEGHSAAAVFPTGGGKSLCYQLPALVLPGVTLVVSPLIALMKDQIDALRARGIAAARLDSSLTAEEHAEVMESVRASTLRLLYVAPERFNNERFRAAIEGVHISLFAVDEAHCVSEWGHNFRPDYLKLAAYAQRCRAERILALTATATPAVLEDMRRCFDIAPECATRTPFYRSNLTVLSGPVEARDRDAELLALLRARKPGPTIVYVTLQRTAQEVADLLGANGFSAMAYHAGMKPETRGAVQDRFMASDDAIVVATIAFGMGIDKANIRYVYHYNLPKSLENFAQEIGRSGRDGAPSICQTFVCLDDLNVLENFVCGDTPSLAAVRSLINAVFAEDERFDVSFYELSREHDIRILVVRTLLTYLELEGYLQGGTPFYTSYRFQPLMPSKDILRRFDEQRARFLRALFCQARKAKKWFSLDVDEAASTLEAPRDRIVRALDYLGETKMLEVQTQGVRHRYQRLSTPRDREQLAESLHQRMLQREEADLDRLHQVVALAKLDGCRVSALGEHFGEPLEAPCGHCSWCLDGQDASGWPDRNRSVMDESVWAAALALRGEEAGAVLLEPRVLARFLCGVGSPVLTHANLHRHPLFGAMAQVPFQDVHGRARGE